jgi:hypothetical protein
MRSARRAGGGALVAFAVWVVAMALLWGFVQSQAQSGALTGVARVTAARVVTFAAQSALEEAAYALRHPQPGADGMLDRVERGGDSGIAHDPVLTRDTLYGDPVRSGALSIGQVEFAVASRPPTQPSTQPWLIDLTVRATYRAGSVTLSRQVRRRFAGRQLLFRGRLGPELDRIVLTRLELKPDVLMEVVQP